MGSRRWVSSARETHPSVMHLDVSRSLVPPSHVRAIECLFAELAHLNATHERSVLGPSLAIVLGLAALVALMIVDLLSELVAGTSAFHAIVEAAASIVGAIALAALVRRLRALRSETHILRERLATSRADAEGWARNARSLIAGLAGAIDEQLERWRLSGAETEIALLLLKGLEHKEIAALRGVSETTVRQQARSLYRKAGLAGRHELAAFFLEDLLGPRAPLEDDRRAAPPAA
jgi:DNA-binding CsgD family transcriptional regulator